MDLVRIGSAQCNASRDINSDVACRNRGSKTKTASRFCNDGGSAVIGSKVQAVVIGSGSVATPCGIEELRCPCAVRGYTAKDADPIVVRSDKAADTVQEVQRVVIVRPEV